MIAAPLADGAVLLKGFAISSSALIVEHVERIALAAPFRNMLTPGGRRMSVAMTNCGPFGWVSDAKGYRYSPVDPESGMPWPALPGELGKLGRAAASRAGFDAFEPDACLINRYAVGAKMSLHQDKDERDLSQPIVSVSLGLPATFQFGGFTRSSVAMRVPLEHGDVVVWGGPSRLRYHGVLTLKAGEHPATGACRINLTLRRSQ